MISYINGFVVVFGFLGKFGWHGLYTPKDCLNHDLGIMFFLLLRNRSAICGSRILNHNTELMFLLHCEIAYPLAVQDSFAQKTQNLNPKCTEGSISIMQLLV